jgi:hypothetical protein
MTAAVHNTQLSGGIGEIGKPMSAYGVVPSRDNREGAQFMELNRRTVLTATAFTAAAAVFPIPNIARAAAPFAQPKLPFGEGDLAPVISAKTVGLHYGKHHKAYFDKLNTLSTGTKYADMDLEAIVVESAKSDADADKKIFNNAAQAWNHVAYWDQFVPGGRTGRRASWQRRSTRRSATMMASSSAPSISRIPCSAPAGCGSLGMTPASWR